MTSTRRPAMSRTDVTHQSRSPRSRAGVARLSCAPKSGVPGGCPRRGSRPIPPVCGPATGWPGSLTGVPDLGPRSRSGAANGHDRGRSPSRSASVGEPRVEPWENRGGLQAVMGTDTATPRRGADARPQRQPVCVSSTLALRARAPAARTAAAVGPSGRWTQVRVATKWQDRSPFSAPASTQRTRPSRVSVNRARPQSSREACARRASM